MADNYHHGNLRQALIDAGIRIINEEGEDYLSLREVAAACDVSHAAPYAHFKNKDELLEAMKKSVTDRITDELFFVKLTEIVRITCKLHSESTCTGCLGLC